LKLEEIFETHIGLTYELTCKVALKAKDYHRAIIFANRGYQVMRLFLGDDDGDTQKMKDAAVKAEVQAYVHKSDTLFPVNKKSTDEMLRHVATAKAAAGLAHIRDVDEKKLFMLEA
jgi:hypothetical protein